MKELKKTVAILLLVVTALCFTGCGNKTIIDTRYTFDRAIIQLPDGTIVSGKVEAWCDYEGEQLQVVIDGTTYLCSSYNCVLIADKK